MKIRTLSHNDFDCLCYQRDIYDDNVETRKDDAFISIIGTEECRKYYLEDDDDHWFKKDHDNVLNLEFDDITEDITWKGHKFLAITEKQADKIIDFISKNKGKNFYVHCKAGISRSGAVSTFIYSFFNDNGIYDKHDFEKYNSHIRPNNYVLTLLKRKFYERNGMFVDENMDFS